MKHPRLTVRVTALIVVMAGCEPRDERLARFVEHSAAQQAQQTHDIVELNRQAADSHRRVVEAAEQSRQDAMLLERDLQLQRERLDDERRDLANERRRESVLVPIFQTLGVLIVCSLPLVLAWYLLHGIHAGAGEEEVVTDVLLRELGPLPEPLRRLESQRRAITHDESPPDEPAEQDT